MDNQKATHLIIDSKKVSILAAGFITLIATSFMIGYFKGYKNNLENKKIEVLKAVSYTHLTLPTIYSV